MSIDVSKIKVDPNALADVPENWIHPKERRLYAPARIGRAKIGEAYYSILDGAVRIATAGTLTPFVIYAPTEPPRPTEAELRAMVCPDAGPGLESGRGHWEIAGDRARRPSTAEHFVVLNNNGGNTDCVGVYPSHLNLQNYSGRRWILRKVLDAPAVRCFEWVGIGYREPRHPRFVRFAGDNRTDRILFNGGDGNDDISSVHAPLIFYSSDTSGWREFPASEWYERTSKTPAPMGGMTATEAAAVAPMTAAEMIESLRKCAQYHAAVENDARMMLRQSSLAAALRVSYASTAVTHSRYADACRAGADAVRFIRA